LRSAYAILWVLLLLLLGGATWWMVFKAKPPASLKPVRSEEVKVDALEGSDAEPVEAEKRPEPQEAFLDQAELSISSADGSTKLELLASEARKDGQHYDLKEGRISIHTEQVDQLRLTVSDGTYDEREGVAYVEGTLQGEILGTGQRFTAERLRWDEQTNTVQAEAVRLTAGNFEVSGERMQIQLPGGLVVFDGPVSASLKGAL